MQALLTVSVGSTVQYYDWICMLVSAYLYRVDGNTAHQLWNSGDWLAYKPTDMIMKILDIIIIINHNENNAVIVQKISLKVYSTY